MQTMKQTSHCAKRSFSPKIIANISSLPGPFCALFFSLLLFLSPLEKLQAQTTSVVTFNNVHQKFGSSGDTRTVVDSFLLPASLAGYKQILMHITLSCPPGGCDPWDRFGKVALKRNTEWLEIGRHMTPYKKACGWTYDVTDYSTLLTGKVVLSTFIDTWVDPGWLVKVTFDYITGTPAIPLTKVENIWQNYGLVYGDPTKTDTFPKTTTTVASTIDSVRLKVVMTGHGQGNTQNAAEFSQKTHTIYVDNVSSFSHYLWRADCGTNPCSPQSGTWQYNRAGWCPGASVIPKYYSLTSKVTPGMPVKLEYRLQAYNNLCRPTNPSCVTGTTCSDCNYNYNGHTEPYYAMSGQMITYLGLASDVNETNQNTGIIIFPNPAEGTITLSMNSGEGNTEISIQNTMGQCVYTDRIADFSGVLTKELDLSDYPKGIYILRLANPGGTRTEKIVLK
jgi:hypothetical protein